MAVLDDQGYFDGYCDGRVFGWACLGPTCKEVITVDVVIDGEIVETVAADQFRQDLQEAGIRGGNAGFSYEIPEKFLDGRLHVVDIRHHGFEKSLVNSPRTLSLARSPLTPRQSRLDRSPSKLVLNDGSRTDDFVERLRLKRKVAIISTYHDAVAFLAYHEDLFRGLSDSGFVALVVHASGSARASLAAPRCAGTSVIVKRNIGYDFGSWAVAVDRLSGHLDEIDELVLLNDSVIPLDVASVGTLLRRARAAGADVVGLTESYEHVYHLQSYFVWLDAPALRSVEFRDFMTSSSFGSTKEIVIAEGELALTKRLMNAGYSVRALCEYDDVATLWLQNVTNVIAEIDDLPASPGPSTEDYRHTLIRQLERITGNVIDGRPMNPSHFFWDTLIERCRFPFLKRELVLVNPSNVPTYYRIGRVLQSRPDVRNTIRELRRVFGGNLLPTFVPPPVQRPSLLQNASSLQTNPPQISLIG